MRISRRLVIAGAPMLAAAPRRAWAQNLARGAFTHGVASGDPLADGVILWTRFVGGDGAIAWEIAEDEAFTTVAGRGEARASPASDYCIKIDARGLPSGRRYFYRFLSGSGQSLTGQTCTAPAEGVSALRLALVSCANYAFGYFHAYRHIAARPDIDLVLHAGDYIYEYGDDEYPRRRDAVAGRVFDPSREIVTLNDYYARYAAYHTDPDLLELRRLKPMACVWDDHEIANQATASGAQNHQRAEGEYVDRVAAASKAYFDWLPIRRPDSSARLYRYLDWGSLARIVLLDTRIAGRDRQLDYRRTLGLRLLQDHARAAAAVEEFRQTHLNDSTRSMLGAEQETWFASTLRQSRERGQPWQIVTQQVVLGPQIVGEGASAMVAAETHSNTRRFVEAAERLGRLGMPWNLDAWDGYPAARARLLQACAALANNAVVLSGDSHNCWLNTLPTEDRTRLAAIEFAGGSVTSPGVERALSGAGAGQRESMMRAANPALAWCDVSRRGYGVLHFTREACNAEWVAFDDVRTPEMTTPTVTRMTASASAAAGPSAWSVQNR